MVDIAVGTKVFMRTQKLQRLLESIEQTPIERVYVADGGEITPEKEQLYDREFDFDLHLIDLEYDAGLGKGRKEIVEQLDEEKYLLIVDSDNEVPRNVTVLADQLEELPEVGGIAGSMVEPKKGRLYQSAKDLREDGNTLVASADINEKEIQMVSGYPFVEFQYLPNITMFRKEAVEEYCWDPKYKIGKEHMDFFVGHWKKTNWKFGVCPAVLFNHYPGGSAEYQSNRDSTKKHEQGERYFYDKWGYERVRRIQSYWYDTESVQRATLSNRAKDVYSEQGLSGLFSKTIKTGSRMVRDQFL